MGYFVATDATPNRTIYAVIQQMTDDGRLGATWDENDSVWDASSAWPLFAADEQILLSEVNSTGPQEGQYSGETTSATLGTYTGKVLIWFVDTTDGNFTTESAYVSQGAASEFPTEWQGADIIEGMANGVEQSIRIRVKKYADSNQPGSGSVVSCNIGYPSGTMSASTNAATYSGIPGIYKLTLTATETDVAADLKDELYVELITSDGIGKAYLNFSLSALESDWATGGALRTQLQTIETYADQIRSDVSYEQSVLWPTVPTAAANADAVWDEAISAHVTAGSAGNLVERLDIIATGGSGELTTVRAAKLDFLDQNVSGNASAADVTTNTLLALQTYHLDHLFAATYDPTSKPGVADSLINTIIESDGGVPRFTANSLEQGPSATVATSGIAAAVWADASGVSLLADVGAIKTDTDELQGLWTTGGARTVTLDATATGTQVSALNNVSTSDIASELSTFYSTTLDPRFDTLDTSVAGVVTTGNSAWTTATGTGLSLTAAAIRSEIDSNSTQLAAILGDTSELQSRWDTGGTYRLELQARSTHSAADVRSEVDSNSTQLAAILTDTDAINTTLAPAGTAYELIDSKADDAIEAQITTIETTLAPGGAINTAISNISPVAGSPLSAAEISDARTWVAEKEFDTATNVIVVNEGDQYDYAMDFTKTLNPDTAIQSAGSVTVTDGDAGDLTIGTPALGKDHRTIHVRITGQQPGKRYTFKVAATTTDSQTISSKGRIKVTQ